MAFLQVSLCTDVTDIMLSYILYLKERNYLLKKFLRSLSLQFRTPESTKLLEFIFAIQSFQEKFTELFSAMQTL